MSVTVTFTDTEMKLLDFVVNWFFALDGEKMKYPTREKVNVRA